MSQEHTSRAHRVDIALKIRLKHADRTSFEEGFSKNISKTGLFIRSREPSAVGTRVHFEYTLDDQSPLMKGIGVVRRIRLADGTETADDPPGMGIEFVDVDASTEELISSIVARYGEGPRAPRRVLRTFQAENLSGAGKAPSLQEAHLDPDEESALGFLESASPTAPHEAHETAHLAEAAPSAPKARAMDVEVPQEPATDVLPESAMELETFLDQEAAPDSIAFDDELADLAQSAETVGEPPLPHAAEIEIELDVPVDMELDADTPVEHAESAAAHQNDLAVQASADFTSSPQIDDDSILRQESELHEELAPDAVHALTSSAAPEEQAVLHALPDEELPAEKPLEDIVPDTGVLAEEFSLVTEPTIHQLVIDLSGAKLGAAVLGNGRTAEHCQPLVVDAAGVPSSNEQGLWLAPLLHWLDVTELTVRDRIMARHLGVELQLTEAGISIQSGSLSLPAHDIWNEFMSRLLDPYMQSHPDAEVLLIVPPDLGEEACRRLAESVELRGFSEVTLQPSSHAVAAAVATNASPQEWCIVAEIGLSGARVSLLQGSRLHRCYVAPDLSLVALELQITQVAAIQILREFEIDVDDDDSLKQSLAVQVRQARQRCGTHQPWRVGVAGAELELDSEILAHTARAFSERLGLAIEDTLVSAELSLKNLSQVVVATEDLFWPDLSQVLENFLQRAPILLELDAWGRITPKMPKAKFVGD